MTGSQGASIRDVLGWSRREPDVRASSKGNGSILIADDEPTNIRLVTRLMSAQGYRILTAANGEEALAVVGRERPDLILLDVNMPKLDGFEVCRHLKSEPETAGIKVVMLTARGADVDRAKGREAGADDYFIKPFSPVQLLNKVYALLG